MKAVRDCAVLNLESRNLMGCLVIWPAILVQIASKVGRLWSAIRSHVPYTRWKLRDSVPHSGSRAVSLTMRCHWLPRDVIHESSSCSHSRGIPPGDFRRDFQLQTFIRNTNILALC